MDRFSRTTEIDTAEITAATMEDDTPKKSKITIIIALIICLLIAVVVWAFVMETDDTIIDKEFDEIIVCTEDGANTTETKTVTIKGVRRNIIEIGKDDIKIVYIDNQYKVIWNNEEKAKDFTLIDISGNDKITVLIEAKEE